MFKTNEWRGPKPQWIAAILSIEGIVWLLLLFPYLPGPAIQALPMNSAHFALSLLVALFACCSLLVTLALVAFALVRRRKDLVPHATTSILIFILSCLMLTSVNWGHKMARHRAIQNAEPILSAIGAYKSLHGTFPDNIDGLGIPLTTGVRGIERYSYEKIEDEFQLSFVIDSGHFNFIVVMYRPSGKYVGKGEYPTIHNDAKWGYYWFD